MGIAATLQQENHHEYSQGIDWASKISSLSSIKGNTGLYNTPSVLAFRFPKDTDAQRGVKRAPASKELWFEPFGSIRAISGILDSDEYIGFKPVELVETEVEYKKGTVFFSRSFKTLLLRRYVHNRFYPKTHLLVCPDLELEGIGENREAALLDADSLFDIYFNETEKLCNGPQDHFGVIDAKINESNAWKQGFGQLYMDSQKKDGMTLSSRKHVIRIEE